MARTKQRVPLQKSPSSEVMEQLSELPDRKSHSQLSNGHIVDAKPHANGHANGKAPAKPDVSQAENSPGLVQLAICVGGIYASLYVCFIL